MSKVKSGDIPLWVYVIYFIGVITVFILYLTGNIDSQEMLMGLISPFVLWILIKLLYKANYETELNKICESCGTNIKPTDKNCTNCGTKICNS